MTTFAWVIGSRGLLGHATSDHIRQRADWALVPALPVPWNNPESLRDVVRSNTHALIAASREPGDSWAIIWAAGAAVTSSTQSQMEIELSQLELILATIGGELTQASHRGSIFYASSAGGVYGGSEDPPFSEFTAPRPISPYGDFKLRAEAVVRAFGMRESVSCLVGRIANLYGPGQKLDKMQGIISHIAKAQMSTAPASIYVSLDTIRDYIFVEDCADLICDALDRLASVAERVGPTSVTKILASGQGTTIATLLGYFRILSKGHPHVMLGSSASASLQGHDLRLRSRVWPELDDRDLTPLPAGIYATILDIQFDVQAGPRAN